MQHCEEHNGCHTSQKRVKMTPTLERSEIYELNTQYTLQKSFNAAVFKNSKNIFSMLPDGTHTHTSSYLTIMHMHAARQ